MKKTNAIKERLNGHRRLLQRLHAMEQELEYLRNPGPKIPRLTHTPRGGGLPGDPVAEATDQIIELEKRMAQKRGEIEADWAELEPVVEDLQPVETLVVNLRYMHGAEWPEISRIIYGKADDYEVEIDRYLNKTFKIHGRALLTMAEKWATSSGNP